MAVKRKKKAVVKPYDPYRPYGNHSAGWFTGEANRRAANDANAAVAALPSASFYTQSAQQLGEALKGIAGQQGTVAAAASPLYAQAFDSASQAANKAALVGGGTGVTATPGGGSLVGALGATMAQALSGGQSAAVARGRNDVIARAGQETAIRAKQVSAAADYLKQMRDEALQASVAGFNNQLAQSQFGLSATNTAFDNNLAAASLNASVASKADSAATKKSSADQKMRDKKLAGVTARYDAWTKPTKKQNGNIYSFAPPGVPAFEIVAKDGPTALALAHKKLIAMGASGDKGVTGTQVASFLRSTRPTYADVPQKSKRDAYKLAVNQLVTSGLYTRKEAIKLMRDYAGVSPNGPLKL